MTDREVLDEVWDEEPGRRRTDVTDAPPGPDLPEPARKEARS